jgi:hypothetical protein
MPPLPGVGQALYAESDQGYALMSVILPGRSRTLSLPTPGKGQARRHRLLRVPACMGTMGAPPWVPQAPRMRGFASGSLSRFPSLAPSLI